MDHDPNQPESSSSGQQPPPLSQQPPSQSELPQEPPLYESPPQWGQQPLPQYRQPPDGPPQYGYWPPQPPKKRSSRWLWITLTLLAGLIALCCIGSAIFVTLRIGSFVRQAGPVTCLPSDVPTTGSSIDSSARQAGPVTTLNDNGPGSLRQAIAVAPSKSTITFDPSLHGTILLTSGDLNIAKDLTIRGPGAGVLSISGSKSGHRVCVLGVSVTIFGLTLKDSNTSNGFINNEGTLTLNNSTVSGNTATFGGGGIFNQDTVTLSYSTIYGNTSTGPGGAGGGIFNQGRVTIGASIVAGNKAHTDPDIAGSLASLGYNLVGDRSGATFSVQQSTDVLGVPSPALRIDPVLRDNGGSAQPHTRTHALLPGSPAIDLIPPEACMMFKVFNDQRGMKRPQGKGCDSGAYEYSQ